MRYVQCPAEFEPSPGEPSIFLAGGISGCDDWQARMTALLGATDLAVVNPRRAAYDWGDPRLAVEQIEWEHRHLRRVTARLFWFPPETLCPVALFEFGRWLRVEQPLFLGIHPDYRRKLDLEVQTRLERP